MVLGLKCPMSIHYFVCGALVFTVKFHTIHQLLTIVMITHFKCMLLQSLLPNHEKFIIIL